MDLHGKVALVTGGARRVGRAITESLAEAGASVVINYNSSAAEADELRADLEKRGTRVLCVQADVSRPSQIAEMIERVAGEIGRLDILVNNASIFGKAPFLDITEEMWHEVVDVNLKGPFFVSQAATPLLRASGAGNIINMADLSAFQAWPSYSHHAVSKAGLVHLTKVMARVLAPEIRVNAIAPGTVLPPDDYDGTGGEGSSDRRLIARKGTPDDVVDALFYLLESNFVTGQVVIVDGGRTLF
jgi:NAD(P)-dependent dehydrogenase (short-subunit alcohol dehydrogenase family)